MLMLIKARRPLRCQPDKSRRCRQCCPGGDARPGEGAASDGMWVPRAAHPPIHPPCCCLPSPADSRQGPKARQEAGGRLGLKSGLLSAVEAGVAPNQPSPMLAASPAALAVWSLSTSSCLRHLPAPFVRVLALYAASHLHLGYNPKTHLLLKLGGEKAKAAATPASLRDARRLQPAPHTPAAPAAALSAP